MYAGVGNWIIITFSYCFGIIMMGGCVFFNILKEEAPGKGSL